MTNSLGAFEDYDLKQQIEDHKENQFTQGRGAFDDYEEEDSIGKSILRKMYQIPAGIAQAFTYPLDILKILSTAEPLDPFELDNMRKAYEANGMEWNEEDFLNRYNDAVSEIDRYFPTQSNIERIVEEKTGAPLTPKTGFEKFTRFASTAGSIVPKGTTVRGLNQPLPRPVIGAGIAGTSEVLKEAGVPEPLADILPFALTKQAGTTGLSFNKKTKPSGLPERQFENLKRPKEVSAGKKAQIEHKVEKDFRKISNEIIESSPVKETQEAFEIDPNYKSKVRDSFKEVQALSEQLPEKINTEQVKNTLLSNVSKKKGTGFKPSEYDKEFSNYLKQFADETVAGEVQASDLVEQYRKNNKELTEFFDPSKTRGSNRAKRDAILEYNRAIADVIETNYPNSEFSKLFKETNAKWTKISDYERINDFVDKMANGKIDFNRVKKFFDNENLRIPFRRALGEEIYPKFEQLMKDVLSTEKSFNLLKVAEKSGWLDLFKTGLSFMIHPNIGKFVAGVQYGAKGFKRVMNAMLDKPQLVLKWEKANNALKAQNFKQADKLFSELKEEIKPVKETIKPSEIIQPKKESSVKNVKQKEIEIPIIREKNKQIEFKPKQIPYKEKTDEIQKLNEVEKLLQEMTGENQKLLKTEIIKKQPKPRLTKKIKPEKTKISSEIEKDRSLNSHLDTLKDDKENFIGELSYDVDKTEKSIFISGIDVMPEYKRMGFGTELIENLKKKYPSYQIEIGPMEPEGAKFFGKLLGRKLKPQLDKNTNKIKNVSQQPTILKKIDKDIKHQDISKEGLKKQKDYFIDELEKIIANPSDYGRKVKIEIPNDGTFIVEKEIEALEKILKTVKSKWPVSPMKEKNPSLKRPKTMKNPKYRPSEI